jgi:hypothetical protein
MKVKRSFVAENQFFRETIFLQVLQHVGIELKMAGLHRLEPAVTAACMA